MATQFIHLCWLALLCMAGVIGFWQISWQWAFLGALMDALHMPGALLLVYCLNYWMGRFLRTNWLILIAITILLIVEVAQPYFGRNGEWHDLSHGLFGVLLAAYWQQFNKHWRVLLLILALLFGSRQLLAAVIFQTQSKIALPNLMVTSSLPTSFGWQPIGESQLQIHPISTTQFQLAVVLKPQQWQGVQWLNPSLDLTPVKEMCFTARASAAMPLMIRIDDLDSDHYQSRFNTSVKMNDAWQRFCIDFTKLKDLQQRTMDKTKIVTVYFFSQPVSENQTSWFALADVSLWQPAD